ncbi:MAG: hypothetical protein H6811_12335, partial [Phycisphaeraceae bacterium]|nr:hypothetical protein [Phycisphaeraceae bacterium]
SRARRHLESRQRRDLEWLGLHWDREVRPQRERDYQPWLDRLPTYFCECSRRTIREGGGNHPLSCRSAGSTQGAVRFLLPPGEVHFVDRVHGELVIDPLEFGDPVLRRRDGVFTYNLAVVADDITDGVTQVVRGGDLLEYTCVQIRLFEAFGAHPPSWMHAPLVLGADGRKLSKSHQSESIASLREAGTTAEEVREKLLGWLGQDPDVYDHPERFDVDRMHGHTIIAH